MTSQAYKEFWNSLREDQKKDFRDQSINMQKDWYISYLENVVFLKNQSKRKDLSELINQL
jgi:hypothetical protein